MRSEEKKLVQMLDAGTISKDDYQLLLRAINKQVADSKFMLLFNPFQKIHGFKVLFLGLAVLLLLGLIGALGAILHYPGVLDLQPAQTPIRPSFLGNFSILLYQLFSSCLVLSLLFFLCAKLNERRSLRYEDFLGMTAFAKFPHLIAAIALMIFAQVDKNFPSAMFDPNMVDDASQPGIWLPIAVVVITFPWLLIGYFSAFKEASGIKDNKFLWGGYIASIILGEAITAPLARIFN